MASALLIIYFYKEIRVTDILYIQWNLNMLMLGQRWPNVCSYVGSTSHANVGSTLFCSLGLRWPYHWRQPSANVDPALAQRNSIWHYVGPTLIQRNLVYHYVGPSLDQR